MCDLLLSAWLFAPLFVGLAANGVCLKYGLLAGLAHPIDGGRTWPAAALFGLVVGAAAMLSEFVNSFVKRRLNIAPGAAADRGWRRLPLYIFDQLDFLLASWSVVAVVVEPTMSRLLSSAVFVFVTHQAVSFAGVALGMRASAR